MVEIENVASIVAPNDYLINRRGVHRFSLRRIVLLSLILWTLSFILSAKRLPDYDSYRRIYKLITGFPIFGWGSFFVYLNYLGKYLRLDYEGFRAMILCLSLTCFIAALYVFSRKLRGVVLARPKQSMLFALLTGTAFVFGFTIFFFEFFIVRIRAGLSLSIVLLAFSLFWPGTGKSGKLKFLVISILLVLAFATHIYTAAILFYFTFYPALLSLLYSKSSFNRQGHFKGIISLFVVLIPAVVIIYAVLRMSFYRGEHLFSELNVFRLIALSVVPLFIIVIGVFSKRYVGLISILKKHRSGPRSVFLLPSDSRKLMMWQYFATLSYFSMAFTLLVFYIVGAVDQSGAGEAIVRLFTLSSPLALFIVLCTTTFYRYFWLLVLLGNSLFFVNTVFF